MTESFILSAAKLDERHRRLGLRAGDRVVSLDGYRVRTEDQFYTVMSFRDDPTLVADVWRGGRLETARGQYPRYRYGPVP